MNRITNAKGFSLIELMVVVAIMAILVTIAVPNFQRFQAKAKQQEAKSNLTAIYMAQKAFHAEWSQYFGDFRDIGYNPEGNLRYLVTSGTNGIPAPSAAVYTFSGGAGGGGAANATFINTRGYCGTITGANCTDVAQYSRVSQNAGAWGANAFRAAASSDLDGDVDIDEWTLDQTKTFRNPRTDL